MEALLVLAVLAVAVLMISAPFRAGGPAHSGGTESVDRAELEAERDAKYREIRDAELDYRTGKLSDEHWHSLDSGLRAEAVEILRRLDALDDSRAS